MTRLRVVLSDHLPAEVPSYYDAEPPPALIFSRAWRDAASWAEQRERLARELAQHVLQAAYRRPHRGTLGYWNACRDEERGRRLSQRTLVQDLDVLAAFNAGCREVWEVAEFLGRTPEWTATRGHLFFVQNPDWLPWLRQVRSDRP